MMMMMMMMCGMHVVGRYGLDWIGFIDGYLPIYCAYYGFGRGYEAKVSSNSSNSDATNYFISFQV